MEWVDAHNDAHVGKKLGWPGEAEDNHARDALKIMKQYLLEARQNDFIAALKLVTTTSRARLEYWNLVVEQSQAIAKIQKAEGIEPIRLTNIRASQHQHAMSP